MCKELDVSRAAYYKWCNHKPSEQELDDIDLGNKIKEMHEKISWNSRIQKNDNILK